METAEDSDDNAMYGLLIRVSVRFLVNKEHIHMIPISFDPRPTSSSVGRSCWFYKTEILAIGGEVGLLFVESVFSALSFLPLFTSEDITPRCFFSVATKKTIKN